VQVKFVVKDGSEWEEFVDATVRSYGFESKSSPMVFTLEGTLIGDGRDFIEHVREKYDRQLQVTKEQQKNRTQLNVDENEERMRRKREGETDGERILKVLEKLSSKKVTQIIDDLFYLEEVEEGIPFIVRRGDFLRDQQLVRKQEDAEGEKVETILHIGRVLNIPDEEV
jgi:hypothetical protein